MGLSQCVSLSLRHTSTEPHIRRYKLTHARTHAHTHWGTYWQRHTSTDILNDRHIETDTLIHRHTHWQRQPLKDILIDSHTHWQTDTHWQIFSLTDTLADRHTRWRTDGRKDRQTLLEVLWHVNRDTPLFLLCCHGNWNQVVLCYIIICHVRNNLHV